MPLLPPREIRLIDATNDGAGPLDTGLSHAIALAVGTGEMEEALRIHRTSDVVAFGRQDVVTPGYHDAVTAARSMGFAAVERLAGGRAAAFHAGTLGFSWAIPAVDPRAGVQQRFARVAEVMVAAFRALGADARIGEVRGEYCPGAFSVNINGSAKVMGVGQRLVRGAAHVGGVVVVNESQRIRDVLVPVYRALDLEWDPASAGALDDALPGLTVDAVRQAIISEIEQVASLTAGAIPLQVAELGRRLSATHQPTVPAF